MLSMKKDPKNRLVMVIDEDADTLELLAEPLRWEGYDVHSFSSPKEASDVFNNLRPQLVIVDPDFSNGGGLDFVSTLCESSQKTPVIIVSSNPNTEKITQFLDLGASDFMTSPFVPMEFLARVRMQLRLRDTQEELLATNQKLQELIEIDDLTGLFNTRSLYSKLEFEIERAARFKRPVTVVMMDMDKFKNVNDGHDHLFGSFVLSEVGKIIKQNTRTVDIPARYGGDEFLIVLSEIPLAGVEFFCERLRHRIEQTTFRSGPDSIKLTVSIGFATFDANQEVIPAKEIVRRADAALYEAKNQGRNKVVTYHQRFDRMHKIEKSSIIQLFDKKHKTVA